MSGGQIALIVAATWIAVSIIATLVWSRFASVLLNESDDDIYPISTVHPLVPPRTSDACGGDNATPRAVASRNSVVRP